MTTSNDRQRLTEQLDRLFATTHFSADGYLVSAGLRRVNHNTLGNHVYVNGIISGKWLLDGSDEALRFWRPVKRRRYPAKFVRGMESAIGKRECQARGYYDVATHYECIWPRAEAFLRHLYAHNQRVEELSYHDYQARLNAIQQREEVA